MIDSGNRWVLLAGAGFGAAIVVVLVASLAGAGPGLLMAAGLIFAVRALYPRIRRGLALQAQQQDQVRARADQQNLWAARGDLRGVYGAEGAELMRAVSPAPTLPPTPTISPPGPDLVVAAVVETPAELTAMLRDKPPAWRYAAFVSVLVQRRAGLQDRIRDARTGFARSTAEAVRSDLEAALFCTERLGELSCLVEQLNDFMLSPAFQSVFGDREENADPDGILHAGNRLMDHHDQFLALNERCRGLKVPWSSAELQREMGRLTALPLEGVNTFIEDFTHRITEAGDVARYATGDVDLDPVLLSITDDGGLIGRVAALLARIRDSY
ncbi:MAG: hypothetical protein ACR2JM_16650 [Mycobacterium sp.]